MMLRKTHKCTALLVFLIFTIITSTACTSSASASIDKNEKVQKVNCQQKIVATSMATVYIMEKLNLDLVGVPHSDVDKMPKRYKDVPEIGSPMNPDQEKLANLRPDWVIGPVSLAKDLIPTYEKLNLNYGFINLNDIPGMYKSINDLGNQFNRKEEAAKMLNEYQNFMKEYIGRHPDGSSKKVLILMGLPGSYIVATEHSYVGSLVKMAGAKNVYSNSKEAFININIEDMLDKNPDIILRTSHAMPREVKKMFADEFKKNNNWSHFKAVKEGKVYDLDHEYFGMSANFNYQEALAELEGIIYDS